MNTVNSVLNKYLVLLIFVVKCTLTYGDEVVGCGGFLKSHVPIDFSKVEIRLVTKQGIIKDKTTAAPNNGYYFVPLYDKGDLRLELSPPPGWSFEPQEVSLSIDGVNDMCSQGKDINFVFQGFGITGKVESLGDYSKGPEGVTVKLESQGESRSTSTNSDGNFFFTPVFPGNYKVSVTHPKWKIYKPSVDVKVAESNAELPRNSLVIQGYDVRGTIKSEGQAVKDATIILFSKDEKSDILVDGCNKNPLKDLSFKKKPLCHVASLENGKFVFGTVPNGHYYIEANFKGQNIYFQPEKIDFTVSHDSIELQEQFEIVGFSISGRVLKAPNIPIANAKISLNGQEILITDKNGYYKLEKIKAGNYQLKAEYDDLIFEKKTFHVYPALQQLPDIFPEAFKVCGKVTSDHSQTVAFTRVGTTAFIETKTSLRDGSFCQYLAPGKYEVKVVVNEDDKQKGLQFFPLTQTMEVVSEKIQNIIFSQLKTNVSGKVYCLQAQDCKGLIVLLKNRETNEIFLNAKGGSYSVNDIYPGTYNISLLPNKFCWESETQTVNINAPVAVIPPFVQKGYIVTFVSSHQTQIHYKVPGQTKNNIIDIASRLNICLEKPGEYTFNLVGCHSYAKPSITYKTGSKTNEITLTAVKHTQTLAVKADSDFGNLQISVKIGTEKKEKILKYKNGFYELEVLLEPSESAVIIPQSDTLFITPPILSVEGGDDCSHMGIKFVAVKGKLFRGKVIPALAGVTITVESSETEKLVIETDANGVFKFPPLDSTKEYKIHAKKDSYVLTGPDENGNFLAHKLAEVVVEVVDGSDNKPLSGVLLSLSGGESYRKNLQSGDDGKISFHSLSPSEYFLRPMMKEYVFEPSSKIINVNEGETVNVNLKGKRVAYSAFGKIVSLNGEPEVDMVIIATGLGNCSHYSEETTCESSGQFRIRGLQPYCSYRVIAKGSLNENYIVERSTPEFIDIESINEDMKDLKLIVFRPATQMDILVKVYAENIDHYKHLKVKVIREEGSPVLVHTAKLETSGKITKSSNPGILMYLPPVPIDYNFYAVQLDTNILQTSKWQPESHHFLANSSFTYAELNFNVRNHSSEQPIKQTSIWSIVFIFTVLFAVYNVEFLADILKDKLNFNVSSLTNLIPRANSSQKNISEYYDDAQIEQIVQSINNPKRKPKPKKA